MLGYDQRKKLSGKWDESKENVAQDKANFNKNMRRKLKLWLKELPDMTLILQSLPARVIENANLTDDLPAVVDFMDTFLEKANPLPVGMHESNEMRNFWNYVIRLNEKDLAGIDPTSSAAEMITAVGDEKYFLQVVSWTATPGEIKQSALLKNHADNIQKYVNPNIIANRRIRPEMKDVDRIQKDVVRSLGLGRMEMKTILPNEDMPLIPPSKPHIVIV